MWPLSFASYTHLKPVNTEPEMGLQRFVTGIISLMCVQYECKCASVCAGNEEAVGQVLK